MDNKRSTCPCLNVPTVRIESISSYFIEAFIE